MLVLRSQPDGTLSDGRAESTVSLIDVRDQICHGKSVKVLDGCTNLDITESVLLKIISIELKSGKPHFLLKPELERLIRNGIRITGFCDEASSRPIFDRDILAAWIFSMLKYADTWRQDFGSPFCAWEYPSLLGKTLIQHWNNIPIEIETAISWMHQGSRKTRLKYLNNVVVQGWLKRSQSHDDRRRALLFPTEELYSRARSHLGRTLVAGIDTVSSFSVVDPNASRICDVLTIRNDGRLDHTHLLPWTEHLVDQAENWRRHFSGEFLHVDFWGIYNFVVLWKWNNEVITFDELDKYLSASPARTLNSRIENAISRGFIKKSKLVSDRRVSTYEPTSKLENILEIHYSNTLSNFLKLVGELAELKMTLRTVSTF